MNNWNYEEAKEFVASIENDVTRTLTSVFLSQLVILGLQRYAVPEADFDLLFYVKMISKIAGDHRLMQACLTGEKLDAGWEGLADVLSDNGSMDSRAERGAPQLSVPPARSPNRTASQ